ncbi:uncharacterized protein [Polyergus mexicanus]|uniref:uncharacterized protein n=1 Tax=Polyergus mexicanus TaxID=615972 RepID=UPI0038B428EA
MVVTSTVSRPVEIGLRFTGIWPNSSINFRLLWSTVMGTGLIFQYQYLLTHFKIEELPNLIDGLSTTLPYNLLFFKLIILWINNRIFNDILRAMSNDWYEYSSMYVMIDKAILSHRYSKVVIGIYSTAVLLYSIATIDFRKPINDDCRQLLIKMELPFVFCESPIYEIVACVQFVHLMAVASTIGMLDALIVTLMLHIGGQIDIMQQQIEEIYPKDNKHGLSTFIVRSLINKHHKIISFSDNIENLFSPIALMQFISNTMIICCIGFLIATSLGTDEGVRMLVKTVFFYIAITLEAFIFCFAGEYISNKSRTIADTVYESLWYDLKPRDSRILLFVIMRSQRRLTITAGKFMDLSLEGFTDILHASGQIDILCDALGEIFPEKNNQQLAVSIMKELIEQNDQRCGIQVNMVRLETQRYIACDSLARNMLKLDKTIMGRASTISESVEAGLRFIGMWPHCINGNINWWTYIASVAVVQYFQYSYILAHFDISDLSVIIDGLSITLGYSLSFLKLINLWFNRRKLHIILDTIDKDWSDGIAIHSDVSTMIRHADLSRQCSNVMITTNALSVFFYTIGGPILRSVIHKNDRETTARELPIKMEFPFNVDNSPIFELILVVQLFHDLSLACIIAMLNALLVTLVLHISGQIDIMRQGLLEISSKNHASLTAIKVLINRHQRIIDLSDNVEDLFSNIALLQFIWNTLVICCIGFLIVISIGTEEGATMITKSLIFYVAITLEAFVFCYAGEYLSAKSKSISDAAYECLWYELTPSECRILMFLMLRSQKRLTVTAGKITDLSLEGFTTVSLRKRIEISIIETETRCLITSDYEIVCVIHICVVCAVLKKIVCSERVAFDKLL